MTRDKSKETISILAAPFSCNHPIPLTCKRLPHFDTSLLLIKTTMSAPMSGKWVVTFPSNLVVFYREYPILLVKGTFFLWNWLSLRKTFKQWQRKIYVFATNFLVCAPPIKSNIHTHSDTLRNSTKNTLSKSFSIWFNTFHNI